MQTMPNTNRVNVIVDGVLTVFYFGRLIALVNAAGEVAWRDPFFPLFLIEYLIENPDPTPEQVRLN